VLVNEHIEFTEAERIEIGRRESEMNSIIHSSSRLFNNASLLHEGIKENEDNLRSYWRLAFLFIGFILHAVLTNFSFGLNLNIGSGLGIFITLLYVNDNYQIWHNSKMLRIINDNLYELERFWVAAINENTFWEIGKFKDEMAVDAKFWSDDFAKWRYSQRRHILNNVLGLRFINS
jgi:hypothetical protein